MSAPTNLPDPVVFGPDFPDFTMITRHGRQVFRSRTNQNLLLDTWDFTPDGTYTMAKLLRATAPPSECYRLLWEHLYFDEAGRVVDWGEFNDEPQWELSEAFTRLLGYSQSRAARHFFVEWSRVQFRRGLAGAVAKWQAGMGRRERPWSWDWRHDEITFCLGSRRG